MSQKLKESKQSDDDDDDKWDRACHTQIMQNQVPNWASLHKTMRTQKLLSVYTQISISSSSLSIPAQIFSDHHQVMQTHNTMAVNVNGNLNPRPGPTPFWCVLGHSLISVFLSAKWE